MKQLLMAGLMCLVAPSAWADSAADRRDCGNNDLAADTRIEACTRLIDTGDLGDAERALILLDRGDAREDLDQWEQVFEDYRAARDLDPENPRVHRYLGWAFLSTKDWAGALGPLNRALQLDPRSAWTYHMRGVAHARQQAYDAALADYDKTLELDPQRVSTYRARAFLRVRREEYDRAVTDFDHVLALQPYGADSYSGRASAHDNQGNAAEAIRDAGTALLLNPNLGVAEDILARLPAPSGVIDPGETAIAPARDGLTVTYLQVVTDAQKEVDEMEAAIMDLVNWFRADPKPLPESRNFVIREVLATEDEVTTVRATLPHSSEAPQEVTYYRGLWPTIFPMGGGGPSLNADYDREALGALWPLEVGRTAEGGGSLNLVCPDEPGPMTAMFQCEAGDRIPMGTISWSASVERWEDVTVPAGVFPTYVISYREQTEMQMFGQALKREVQNTWWYAPDINWWVRRTSEAQGKANIIEAVSIE